MLFLLFGAIMQLNINYIQQFNHENIVLPNDLEKALQTLKELPPNSELYVRLERACKQTFTELQNISLKSENATLRGRVKELEDAFVLCNDLLNKLNANAIKLINSEQEVKNQKSQINDLTTQVATYALNERRSRFIEEKKRCYAISKARIAKEAGFVMVLGVLFTPLCGAGIVVGCSLGALLTADTIKRWEEYEKQWDAAEFLFERDPQLTIEQAKTLNGLFNW